MPIFEVGLNLACFVKLCVCEHSHAVKLVVGEGEANREEKPFDAGGEGKVRSVKRTEKLGTSDTTKYRFFPLVFLQSDGGKGESYMVCHPPAPTGKLVGEVCEPEKELLPGVATLV